MNNRVEFTGIVVTYNEEKYLKDCLLSLAFCKQLIVIDLGSTDRSIQISIECGAEVMHHKHVPIVEQLRKETIKYAKYDWIIFLDPDEIFLANVEDELRSMIFNDPNLGVINVKWQFYFKGRPLNCTIWGLESSKAIAYHKHRNKFTSQVHRGTQLLNDYTKAELPEGKSNYLRHYWADSYRQLFRKHWRYIKKEGEARYSLGERFSWSRLVTNTLSALKSNLVDYKGFEGGLHGIILSIFYSWYRCMSLLSLLFYQNHLKHKTIKTTSN
jgi:glycosyltransferase involved in cell wall biosynthesis